MQMERLKAMVSFFFFFKPNSFIISSYLIETVDILLINDAWHDYENVFLEEKKAYLFIWVFFFNVNRSAFYSPGCEIFVNFR